MSTFARTWIPLEPLMKDWKIWIGRTGHGVHTRPTTRYAGAADIQSATREKPPPCQKTENWSCELKPCCLNVVEKVTSNVTFVLRSCTKKSFGDLWKFFQNWPQNGTKFLKNRPPKLSWSTLGTLLAPRWPKSDTKTKNLWKILNFEVARGVQNKKCLLENRSDFCNDLEIVAELLQCLLAPFNKSH